MKKIVIYIIVLVFLTPIFCINAQAIAGDPLHKTNTVFTVDNKYDCDLTFTAALTNQDKVAEVEEEYDIFDYLWVILSSVALVIIVITVIIIIIRKKRRG